MHIFLSAGEPSGDQHAAHLIEELRRQRPDATFTGFGGPLMERAGCELLYRLTDLAVMFIFSAIPHLRTFVRLAQQAEDFFRGEKPDAVILVDYPGFNWHIARRAKAAGIPVFYYLPPQLWAWAPWRAKKMRKLVDHVLSGLPFEPEWYARRGIEAEYVGHPFFDETAEHPLDREFCDSLRPVDGKLLGVLPGSRDKEIERNWPIMLQVLQRVHAELPHVRFAVASYNERQRDRCIELVQAGGESKVGKSNVESRTECMPHSPLTTHHSPLTTHHSPLPTHHSPLPTHHSPLPTHHSPLTTHHSPLTTHHSPLTTHHFHVGRTPEIIEAADCCLMVSGSVSLEMLARTTPACVIYSLTRIANFFKNHFLNVPYITLPNLFAGREVLPEWVVSGSPRRAVEEISTTLCGWLTSPRLRMQRVAELRELRDAVMRTGASRNTAAAILRRLPPPLPQHSSPRRAA